MEDESQLAQVLAMMMSGGGVGKSKITAPNYQAFVPSQATQSLQVQAASNPYAGGYAYGSQGADTLRTQQYNEALQGSNQLAAALAQRQMAVDREKNAMQYLVGQLHNYPGVDAASAVQQGMVGLSGLHPALANTTGLGQALMQAGGLKDLGSAVDNGIAPSQGLTKALGAVGATARQKGKGKSDDVTYTSVDFGPYGTTTVKGTDPGRVKAGAEQMRTRGGASNQALGTVRTTGQENAERAAEGTQERAVGDIKHNYAQEFVRERRQSDGSVQITLQNQQSKQLFGVTVSPEGEVSRPEPLR